MLRLYRLKPKVGQRKKLSATSVKNDMYDSVSGDKNEWEKQVPKTVAGSDKYQQTIKINNFNPKYIKRTNVTHKERIKQSEEIWIEHEKEWNEIGNSQSYAMK